MLPVILSLGPLNIRSFGLFLLLGFIACLFVVWKRTREEGLAEEKVIDIFFLATGALLIFGRLGFVLANWSMFQQDFGRIILLFRYPGVAFSLGLLAASLVALGLSRLFLLPALIILDILFLGVALATPFWFFGCFLDGCNQTSVWQPLVLTGVFLAFFVLLRFVLGKIRKSPDLYTLSKRAGWVTLCYLIFTSLSLLISSYVLGEQISRISMLILVVASGGFLIRYFEFLKGVQWSSFPKAFSHKLAVTLRTVAKTLRRESQT